MRDFLGRLAWVAILLLAACVCSPALATTTVHVEWQRQGVVYGAQTITSSGTSAATSAAPNCGGAAVGCRARITVVSGAAAVTWGDATPTATQTNGVRLAPGIGPIDVDLAPGQMVAAIEASDPAPSTGTGGFTAVTVGVTSAQALAAVNARRHLSLDNESTSATVACRFGAAAALNTAGSYTIPPGQTLTWSGDYVPADQLNCIASAAATPLTVEAAN